MTQAFNPSATQPYMLTLCQLAGPVTIRVPESPQLKQFKFFMSRSRQGDGREQFKLHMGYFRSFEEAERWAQALRGRYPEAVAARAPQETPPAAPPSDPSAITDTQVLRVLEARRSSPTDDSSEDRARGISLVSPEDTGSRRALKDAVTQGAPVSFAVQLLVSETDIDVAKVPSLSIFRAHTLYKVSGVRAQRAWHALRLGFFRDAISAKQVGYYVRSRFGSVAVVPVTENERTHAIDHPIETKLLCDDFQRSIDATLDADRSQTNAQKSAEPGNQAAPATPGTRNQAAPATPAQSPTTKRGDAALEQSLAMLAADEMWNDPESLTETGVRHLKFEIQKNRSSR
jgi:hypothetical protein